jgi:hypothetical protein
MFIGAPLTKEAFQKALAGPPVAVPIPPAYLRRLIDAGKVMDAAALPGFRAIDERGKAKRLPKGSDRTSRLAFFVWSRLGPLASKWDTISTDWQTLTTAWSASLVASNGAGITRGAARPETEYAFREWLAVYDKAARVEGIGVEDLAPEEIRRDVMKRIGPAIDRGQQRP